MLKILSRAIGILLVLCLIVNPGLATAVSQQKLVECHAMSLSATTAFHDQAFALRSGVVPMAQWKWKPVVYVFSLTAAALGFASHARYFHVHIWPVILGAISTFPFVSWIEISLLGSGGLIAAFFSQDDPEKLHNMDVMKALPKAVEEFLLKRPTPTDRPIIFSGPILDLLNQLGGAKFKAKPEHEKIQTVAHVGQIATDTSLKKSQKWAHIASLINVKTGVGERVFNGIARLLKSAKPRSLSDVIAFFGPHSYEFPFREAFEVIAKIAIAQSRPFLIAAELSVPIDSFVNNLLDPLEGPLVKEAFNTGRGPVFRRIMTHLEKHFQTSYDLMVLKRTLGPRPPGALHPQRIYMEGLFEFLKNYSSVVFDIERWPEEVILAYGRGLIDDIAIVMANSQKNELQLVAAMQSQIRSQATNYRLRDRYFRETFLPALTGPFKDPIVAILRGTWHDRLFRGAVLNEVRVLNVLTRDVGPANVPTLDWLQYRLEPDPLRPLNDLEMLYLTQFAKSFLRTSKGKASNIDVIAAMSLMDQTVLDHMEALGPIIHAGIEELGQVAEPAVSPKPGELGQFLIEYSLLLFMVGLLGLSLLLQGFGVISSTTRVWVSALEGLMISILMAARRIPYLLQIRPRRSNLRFSVREDAKAA